MVRHRVTDRQKVHVMGDSPDQARELRFYTVGEGDSLKNHNSGL